MKLLKPFQIALLLVPVTVLANDFPTLDRVDTVLTCMKREGGQTVDNLYACSCELDVIAQHMKFEDYNEARTYEQYKRMPGEKGGIFRDNQRGEEIVGELNKARADARKRCFIGRPQKQEAGGEKE